MNPKNLLPWAGDKRATKAWDEVFSRETLGAVVLGASSGKVVEYLIALVVLVALGPDAPALWETVGYLAAWATAVPVGIAVFVYWHRIESEAEEVVEEVTDD